MSVTGYENVVWWIERGIGLVNLAAHGSWLAQQKALISSSGILPAVDVMSDMYRLYGFSWKGFSKCPTVFWWGASDRAIVVTNILGVIASLWCLLGLPCASWMAGICMVTYLSLRNVSGIFLGLQMDVNLVELNFIYFVSICCFWDKVLCILLLRWLVFRVSVSLWAIRDILLFAVSIMLGCGAVKYSTGDVSWRNLTAMHFHYETQPLPNPLSVFAHRLPPWMHRLEVIMTFVVELPMCFLVFGGALCRVVAFVAFVGLNVFINITGNYGFLGLMTTVTCFSLLDDDLMRQYFPSPLHPILLAKPERVVATTIYPEWFQFISLYWSLVGYVFGAVYVLVSLVPLESTFRGQMPWMSEICSKFSVANNLYGKLGRVVSALVAMDVCQAVWNALVGAYRRIYGFHICNRYGKFGSMRTYRYEFILEGTHDIQSGEWTEYEFRFKPGNVNQVPVFAPLHLPRLDWRIWFLSSRVHFRLKRQDRVYTTDIPDWYIVFVTKLLEGDQNVMALLKTTPFSGSKPPTHIRTRVYNYQACIVKALLSFLVQFPDVRGSETRQWWSRELLCEYGPPMTLDASESSDEESDEAVYQTQ